MRCSKCGTVIPDDDRFCYNCGAKVEEASSRHGEGPRIQPKPVAPGEPVRTPPGNWPVEPGQTPPASSGKRKTLIAIITAVVVVLAGLGVAVVVNHEGAAGYTKKMEQAQKYVDDENYEAAIKTYDEAIAIEPKKHEAYLEKADVQIVIGDYPGAIVTLKEGNEKATETGEIKEKLKTVEGEYSGVWKTAYRKVLEENETDILRWENSSTTYGGEKQRATALSDITGDGVPELFIIWTDDPYYSMAWMDIYTINGDAAEKIDYVWTNESGDTSHDGFRITNVDAGTDFILFREKGKKGMTIYTIFPSQRIRGTLNRYSPAEENRLEETLAMGYTCNSLGEDGDYEGFNPQKAEYFSKGKPTSRESYDSEYSASVESIDEVIFYHYIHGGDGIPDGGEEVRKAAGAKEALSMTYDEMLRFLTAETATGPTKPQTSTPRTDTSQSGNWYDSTIAMYADLDGAKNDSSKLSGFLRENDSRLPGHLKTFYEEIFTGGDERIFLYKLADMNGDGNQELYIALGRENTDDISTIGMYVKDKGTAILPGNQANNGDFLIYDNCRIYQDFPIGQGVSEKCFRLENDRDVLTEIDDMYGYGEEEYYIEGEWKRVK